MLQLKIGGALAAAAIATHTLYVRSERAKAPTGRLLQFSPASQDTIIADKLKTGDLILFSRDCTLYSGMSGLTCVARKRVSPYDQAGIILLLQGEPHVVELTHSGTKLRRYDARIKTSRSKEVVVRPLAKPLDREKSRVLTEHCIAAVGGDHARILPATTDFFHTLVESGYNPSVRFVKECYETAGVELRPDRGNGIVDFVSGSQPLANNSYSRDVWVRDLR